MHQRLKRPCPLLQEQVHDGFDKAKEAQLKNRSNQGLDEKKKWEETFKILFPNDPVPASPCE
jgi:hypothetical protein